jgi:hypothetical protein
VEEEAEVDIPVEKIVNIAREKKFGAINDGTRQ